MANQGMGLMRFKGAGQMQQEAEAERLAREQADAERRRMELFESGLAGHLRKCWEAAKVAKQPVERRMLDCLRRRKGEYTQQKMQEIREQGGSAVYMMLTATKCRAASAWVRDILLPENERCWGLEPTPVSDIPPELVQQFQQQLAQRLQQQGQQGAMPSSDELVKQLRRMIEDRAREAADKMEQLIEDQLAEGGWEESLEQFADDFSTYPGAVIRAPNLRRKTTLEWAEGWELIESERIQPEFDRVSPFDLYPSPDASGVDREDAAFIIERVRYRRSTLQSLKGAPGYSDEAIDNVLRDYGQGGLRNWLWSDNERAELEGRGQEWMTPADTIDGLVYYGSAQGQSLIDWGMPADRVPDALADYEVEAVLIGKHVVRAVLNTDPLKRRPYNVASYQPVPGSFWGQAIPELMADLQDTCNALARAIVNNAALASGPMVEVNYDRLKVGAQVRVQPWAKIETESSPLNANDPAIRFYQPQSNVAELMGLYEKFELKADDATSIPRYSYGNEHVGGAGQTASGLSMLMDSANKVMKDAVRHIDRGVIRRVIDQLWLHNMRYHPDNSVKGDCRAVPKGSSAMLNRERAQQARQQFLQAAMSSEAIMQLIGHDGFANLVRHVAQALDLPDLVPSDDEVERNAQQSQQQAAQQQKLNQAEQQAGIQKDQADAQKTMAETQYKGVEAQHEQAETQKTLAEIRQILNNIASSDGGNDDAANQAASGSTGRPAERRQVSGNQGAGRSNARGLSTTARSRQRRQ